MNAYEIIIFYSVEDGGYIAEIPELAHCSAFGSTPAQALEQVELARDAWLDAARREGRSIPRPKARAAR
jgi:predicted RNase H-like HicB family nuclease